MSDYFETDRLIEDLAKVYSTAFAAAWFRVTKKKNPTREEFRKKVAEYMKHFEYSLATFPQTQEADQFKEYAKKALENEIGKVLGGENKEVEKRYRYFVDYS